LTGTLEPVLVRGGMAPQTLAASLPEGSGVLLHPTSLPGGRLGPAAYRFVDWLAEAGQCVWQVLPLGPPDRYGSPYRSRSAFAGWTGFLSKPRAPVDPEEVRDFMEREAYWAEPWRRAHGAPAIEDQVRFSREWGALRDYAHQRGVSIMGDIPIYVGPESVEERAYPGLFQRRWVSGCPPDYFTEDGQLWGNQVYDWPAMRRDKYRFWVERIRRNLDLYDAVRIDHFRGFVAYWRVPRGARTARDGRWVRGPGGAPLEAAARTLGRRLPLVAEDLGVITPPVSRLRDELGLPGMRVLQFAFDGVDGNMHLPHQHPENAVVYTGTHDNDTTAGWWSTSLDAERARAREAMTEAGVDEKDPVWGLIRLAHTSKARLAIIPMQDILGLGSAARMNTPGRLSGNWSWRMRAKDLTAALAERLKATA
jgi:4-alpha-glucanotransferase